MSITATKKKASPGQLFVGQSTDDLEHTDDFVDDVLRVVACHVPGMTQGQAMAAAAAVRDRWGGDRPYIARRAGEGYSARNEKIRQDYLRGERLELLERRYHLSKRHLIRIVKA
jgi:Mor family transcriptional regulator